ncbi:MAG: ABC transporter ATP-binding protein [Candidatus Thermoplasmatota archaeon]|nr:ABC transporter ATP-binding protein [Candidatus Thermoplasmatota archaeon]MBU4255905.1 ABC transporter ATP-binding protein [Candidatus Thermoplasmatota archaeon]MCG2825032.1 ABC transporter ATP-binding protein [Thermoplasmatales archaeon]
MIVVDNLTKTFTKKSPKGRKKEKITAVDHINLKINKGEIFGLIGPNGAGKTTTIKILSTLILPDEGTVTINGYDVVRNADVVRKSVGVLAGEFTRALYWRLSGKENLKFFAKLRNMWDADKRIEELIEMLGLKKWENELIMKYSTGMKHKLALAVALLTDPPILFLDEPLTGIDPITTYELKNLIKNEFKDKTIIWASHNLYEIEEMCDRIALINNGKIVLEGSPEKLKKEYWDYEKVMVVSNDASVFAELHDVEIKNNIAEIRTKDVTATVAEITDIARKKNVKLEEIKTLKPTLEEIFMAGVKNAK